MSLTFTCLNMTLSVMVLFNLGSSEIPESGELLGISDECNFFGGCYSNTARKSTAVDSLLVLTY